MVQNGEIAELNGTCILISQITKIKIEDLKAELEISKTKIETDASRISEAENKAEKAETKVIH